MADSNNHPNQTATQAHQFLDKMQALQEISLELFRTNSLEELYRRAVELGRSRLGFDRLGLLLYDEAENLMRGTFGTDDQGNLRDERDLSSLIEDAYLLEILRSPERIGYLPETQLMDYGKEVGRGWSAISALWSGDKGIGWLATDNLLSGEPVSYHLDLLKLYGSALGHIIEHKLADEAEREKAEQDLYLHRAALETAVDAVVITDPQGQIIWVNKAFTTLTQYQREEAIGGNPRLLKSGVHDTAFYQNLWETLKSGQVWQGEIINRRKDGTFYPEEMSITPIKSADGQITHFIAIKRDISKRQETESALRENQERLAEATRIAHLHYWEFDVPSQQFTFLPEYYDLLGATVEEEGGYTMSAADYARNYIPPEEAAIVGSEITAALQTTDPDFRRDFISYNLTKDGHIFPIRVRYRVIKDANGQTVKLVGANQDITEQMQAEQALRERENFYRQILDAITQMVLVKGEKSRILWANKAFRDYYGMDNEALQGMIDAPFNEPDYTLQYIRDDAHVFETGQVLEIPEEPVTRYDGYIGLFQTIKSPIFDESGQVIATVGVSDEITARKAAENELRENQARLDMANQVVENSPVILFRWRADENWSVEYVSENIARFGYSREELLSGETPYATMVYPEDLARVAQEVGDYSASGVEQFTQEYRIVTKDGQVRWTDDRTVIIRDAAGQITHYQGIVIDITERKVAEEALARNALELETVARVSAATSTILETDKLLQEVVDLTKSQFGLYHAHIYLFDEAEKQLVLAAGSGEVGHQMVASGRAIPLDHPHSLVARAARERQAAIVNNVRQDADFLPNPLLPNTRAELAAPMIIGDRLVGVFDVQADIEDYFTEQHAQTHSTLAIQVAVALQNARLFEESEKANALLQERLKELDCLSDIGRKMGEQPAVPELLEWVAGRLPGALQRPELAVVAIEYGGQTYGVAEAAALPRQIVQSLRVEGKTAGRVILAYTEPIHFLDEESALLGDVARRLSGYIESQNLNRALANERRTLSAVLNSAPAGIFVAEAPSGNPILANEQAAEMLGRGLLPGVDRESLAEVYDAYLYGTDELYPVERLPLVRSMFGESSRVDDMEVRRPDGKRLLLEVIGAPIYDESGKVSAGVIMFQDITERKRSEEELRQRETRFSSLVSNIPGAVYRCAWDDQFTMYFLSDLIEEVTGYPSDDFIDNKVRSYASILHPEDAAALNKIVVEAVEQHRVYSLEYRLFRADGSVAWVYEKGQATYGEQGEVLWLDGAIFDVTDRKRAEEMVAKRALELEAVAEVSAAVSTIRETNELLQTVVDLTKSRFALYHAHIYLLNARGDSLELVAGAGEIGRQMVAQGRSIPLNLEQSLVAQAGRNRHSRVVNNVHLSPDWLPNPLLPDTQSEMAIPILLGEQLLGVLDVQSDKLDYFTAEDERIQTTLAAQVAIALENARSFEQSRRAVEELNALTRQLTREGWAGYRERFGAQELGYVYDISLVSPLLPVTAVGGLAEERVRENGRSLAHPLIIHGEAIGQLAIFDEEQNAPEATDLAEIEAAEIVAAVAEQLSARLENLRLTEQTQIALAETAEQAERLTLLNQIAQVISQTIERDQMLEAVYQQMGRVLQLDAFYVSLYNPDAQTLHYPILYEAGERQPPLTVPLRPESNSYQVIQTGEAVLRHLTPEELAQILAGQTQTLPGQAGRVTASLLFAPLRAGQQMLGVISAQSYQHNAYTEADLQLISGIAGYVAVALENATLFANTRQRAATLQKLSEIETALSLAQTEDEIVSALISQLPQENMLAATLGYLEQVSDPVLRDDSPISLVSLWISGQFMPEMLPQFQHLPLGTFPSSELWRENIYTPTLIGDVWQESSASETLREQATAQGWRSIALLPLLSGGRWQGLISINWSDAREFTEDDAFLLNRLMEPIAAVVASRRAQLAQQEALEETEMLYTAGAALNAAQTYDDILGVVRLYTVAGQSQSASLGLFDRAWTTEQMPDWINIAAYFSKRTGVTVPMRYSLKHFPSAATLLKADSPTIIENIDDPMRGIDENTYTLYAQQFGSKAVVFAPLVVAGQWIGYVNLLYREPRSFSEAEIRRLTALSTQAAVAVQNVLSAAETRARADELSILNEMSRALATMLQPEEVIQSIYRYTSQLIDATNFYLALYDAQTNEVSFPYAVENGERVFWSSRTFGKGLTEYLLRSGQPLLVESDLQQWIESREDVVAVGQAAQSWLGVPMISGRQAVGAIVVQSEAPYQFNNNHLNLLSAVSSQTTIALQNARLFQQTEARAQREQILREITARVRGSADVETIMKTAVQEIGQILGRKALIILGDEHGA